MTITGFTYWFIGVLSMVIGLVAYPYVKGGLSQIYTYMKPKKRKYHWRQNENTAGSKLTLEQIVDLIDKRLLFLDNQNKHFHNRMDELDEQIDTLAEKMATRERNRKYNTRRDVREYLEELRDSK